MKSVGGLIKQGLEERVRESLVFIDQILCIFYLLIFSIQKELI